MPGHHHTGHHHTGDHHTGHDHTGHHHQGGEGALAELLDLGGEVLRDYWTEVLDWLASEAGAPALIADIGAGTGVGTVALAERFPEAQVLAVDSDEEMLARAVAKAQEHDLGDRVRAVLADLDAGWPAEVAGVDLSFASLSLHHLADPDRVLRDLFAATRPGGHVAVAEFGERLRYLPDDVGVGTPGLESRCLDALDELQKHDLPEIGTDWTARLGAAGFAIVEERTFRVALEPPQPPVTRRYAELWLQRMRDALTDSLASDDVATLEVLLDGDGPQAVRNRHDVHVHGSRTVTLARRA